MKKTILFLFVLGTFVLSAQESANEVVKIDEEFKADTIKLMKLTSATIFMDLIYQMQAGVPDANKEAFAKEAEGTTKGLMGEIAAIYMQEFTHNEVKDMVSFYESPTGKKMASKTGPIMQKSMTIGQSWAMELQQLVQKYSN